MRIGSWNVESIRAHESQVLNWLAANDLDVLCMQETRAAARRFPVDGFRKLGYDVALCGGGEGRGGVAVAHRVPIDDVEFGIPGAVAPLNEPRSISFEVGEVRVHTCYAPNGRKVGTRHHEIKLAWFHLFSSWVALGPEAEQRLVVGDLNIAPLDIDIWEPSRYRRRNLTSPPERRAFEALLTAGGLIDVVRDRLGDDAAYTWWNRRSDFYETDRGWRLDHVLASPELAVRIEGLAIDRAERGRDGSTDHAPIRFSVARRGQPAT